MYVCTYIHSYIVTYQLLHLLIVPPLGFPFIPLSHGRLIGSFSALRLSITGKVIRSPELTIVACHNTRRGLEPSATICHQGLAQPNVNYLFTYNRLKVSLMSLNESVGLVPH
jgi:hypothetical protein